MDCGGHIVFATCELWFSGELWNMFLRCWGKRKRAPTRGEARVTRKVGVHRFIWILIAVLAGSALSEGRPCRASDVHDAVYGSGSKRLRIATGCPGEYGLLQQWSEVFSPREDVVVQWRRAGPEKALQLLKKGDADVAILHNPTGERAALAEGWARGGAAVCSNEFQLVGPVEDPAHATEVVAVEEAMRRIAGSQSRFYSRGDNTWAHRLERTLWRDAGIVPQGEWYVVTGACSTEILGSINKAPGYILMNSSAFAAHRKEAGEALKVIFRSPERLRNVFCALYRAPVGEGTDGENLAEKFVDFVSSAEGQTIVADFGSERFGVPLFAPAR